MNGSDGLPQGGITQTLLGKQAAWVDGNLIKLRLSGPFDEEDARAFYDLAAALRAKYGKVFCIADMKNSGPPTDVARRHIVERFRNGAHVDAFVYVGANLMIRAMIRLLTNAVRLVTGSFTTDLGFVDSEHEARDWLRQRQHLSS